MVSYIVLPENGEKMNIVNIEKVSKSYHGKKVLENIDLHIRKGEIFGLLGPSGVGKSTLIRLITAQTQADGGVVNVFGCNTNKWDNRNNLKFGIMVDNIGVCERMTCMENLVLFCKILGVPDSIAVECLKKVGMYEAAGKTVTELSKGMRQRLMFARALLNSPELIILDEPTSDLDPKTTLLIHDIIKEQKAQNKSVIIATHDMQEALELCDNIGIVYDGKMVEYGTPQKICNKYNIKSQIVIVDKAGDKHVYDAKKDSADAIRDYLVKEDISDIYMNKTGLTEIFLKLTGGLTDAEDH